VRITAKVMGMCLFLFGMNVFAGDLTCYGYISTTNHFACNIAPANSGNCVWWAAYKRPDLASAGITGNAGEWYDNAKNLGFNVGSEPRIGAIVVFSNPGHVAYTESASGDGSFGVSEMDAYGSVGFNKGVNYATYYPNGDGTYHRNDGTTRWTLKGFIYKWIPTLQCSPISPTRQVCWLPKSPTDVSCENATAWGIEDSATNTSQPADKSICSGSCYNGPVSVLDFFIRPAFAGTLTSCSKPKTESGPESPGTPPVTGPNTSGDLPNLVMRDVYLEDANQNKVTRLHVGERGLCHMSVVNNGKVKAKGTFENRCWVSVGNKFDGKGKAVDIGKQDMTDLDNGKSRVSREDFVASEYPGTKNLVGCADASSKIVESNEKDNCNLGSEAVLQEYVFEVWSSPNLATTAINLSGISGNPALNQPFSISSTTTNRGENFGQDYVSIGYFLDGALVGQNQILRSNMQGGMSKTEEIPVPGGITTAGIHEVKACADFVNAITETDETDNCMTILVNVATPNVPKPSVLSVTSVTTSNDMRHVFTDDRPDISVNVKNTGGASSPMIGEVFISSVPHGNERISLGIFSISVIPEGGNAVGTIPSASFTQLGPWMLTACLNGKTLCFDGDVITVESSHPLNRHVSPAVLFIINRHAR